MPTPKQVEVAHAAWETAAKQWILDQYLGGGRWCVYYRPPLGPPNDDITALDKEQSALHIFDDKADALWFKRERLIEAVLTAVEKMKETKANVEG